MNDFWDQLILDNPVKSYAYVVISVLIGLLFKRIASRFIAGQLFRVASTLDSELDKQFFVRLLLAPSKLFWWHLLLL